ncbi:MAG: response regulator [Deltaproteobacteria bacterium]|nr:response regulator [Deltaproteobacteria bacterium]
MSDGLDVIIIDDDSQVREMVSLIIRQFYTWGRVLSFTNVNDAIVYCREQQSGVAIFVLDVFMKDGTGFSFLDQIADRFPMAYEDTIIITGNASDDVVNMCIASDITHLLEKPLRAYTLQLAVRAIVSKYIKFAKKLRDYPELAEEISNF